MFISLGYSQTYTHGSKVKLNTTPASAGTDEVLAIGAGNIITNTGVFVSSLSSPTGLEAIDEGNGIGWRLIGKAPTAYGDIGLNSVDLSDNTTASTTRGAAADFSSITGGYNNRIEGTGVQNGYAGHIGGGYDNVVEGEGAVIAGGIFNNTWNYTASLVGGYGNSSRGNYSFVGGGEGNYAYNIYDVVCGGYANVDDSATGGSNFMGGGYENEIFRGNGTIIVGGISNQAHGGGSMILGGVGNITRSYNETVLGLYNIDIAGNHSSWIGTDGLLTVGNGTSDVARSNALRILKDGTITAPSLTPALITTAGNPALITKEYGDANYLGTGNVTKVGTPVNEQVGTWTGDGTLAGSNKFTYNDGLANLNLESASGGAFTVSNTTTSGGSYMDDVSMRVFSSSSYVDISPSSIVIQSSSSFITTLTDSATGTNKDIVFPDESGTIALNKSVKEDKNTTYNFVIKDANNIVTFDHASPVSAVIPANASVAYPIGTQITVINLGAGIATISITTDTLNSGIGTVFLDQYDKRTLTKVAITSWILGY